MRIKMLRNVLVEGQHCAAGEVIEVEDRLAGVLIQWHRAEAVGGQESAGGGQESAEEAGEKEREIEIETATRPAASRRRKGEL